MAKKIFAISTLLLVLLIGAIFVYNFVFKSSNSKTQKEAVKTEEEGKTANPASPDQNKSDQPAAGETKIGLVSADPVFGATLAPEDNFLFVFSAANGQLNQFGLSGKLERVLSTEKLEGFQEAIWNRQKSKAILRKEISPGKSAFVLLDLVEKKTSPLKENVDAVSWSDSGDKILYKYYDPKTKDRTVNISDPDGSNWKKIADTAYFNLSISPVPGSTSVSFWPGPDAYLASKATLVSLDGKNEKDILAGRFGADLFWSPDGKKVAVSSTDQEGGKKMDLAVMNAEGGEFQPLSFPTFAKKCTWSQDSKFLFCALPGNIPETSILPNEWQTGAITTSDTFWKIEVATGKKMRLVDPEKIGVSFDAFSPFLSRDEKALFFTNKADKRLYRLDF